MKSSKWWIAPISVLVSMPVLAQEWPTKPIRLILGFAPGGGSDAIARPIAIPLAAVLGQQIVIDNRPGANGVVGTHIAAKSPPDGYTYFLAFDNHATNPFLQKSLPYDTIKDFAPITLLATSPYALMVAPASPYRGLKDLIAAAKAKPGQLTLGTGGVGSRGHLAMELLGRRAGFTFTQIPYRGAGLAAIDVMGGQIVMQMGSILFSAPLIKGQRLRAIAVTSTARVAELPDVPTVAEQGYPGYDVQSWWGIIAPAGVPKPILDKMHGAVSRVLAQPDTRARIESVGATPLTSTPAEFMRNLKQEMQVWGKVVRDSKISASE